jgi:hypothetical protein
MNPSKLYVPNPQKWIDYFKNNKPQVGRGFAIPHKSSTGSNGVTINVVSPTEQTVDQAKSELKRDGIKTSEISSLVHKLGSPSTVQHLLNKKKRNTSKHTFKKGQNSVIKTLKTIRKKHKKGHNIVEKAVKKTTKTKRKNTKKGQRFVNIGLKKKPITTWDIFSS